MNTWMIFGHKIHTPRLPKSQLLPTKKPPWKPLIWILARSALLNWLDSNPSLAHCQVTSMASEPQQRIKDVRLESKHVVEAWLIICDSGGEWRLIGMDDMMFNNGGS